MTDSDTRNQGRLPIINACQLSALGSLGARLRDVGTRF